MLEVGVFVVPSAKDPETTVAQAIAAEEAGLDYVAVQDHPYRPGFFDTWTLISYLAGRTKRIGLVSDVLNLPLRLPSVVAKSAASLDLLSRGRIELGIGAGNVWDGIEAMGGPRRTPKQSVDALEEAIPILRAFWSGQPAVNVQGEHYRVSGAKPGPAPAHRIGLWIGAFGPRMLRLTGRLGDGWLPSLGPNFLSPDDIAPMQGRIDEAARRADRDPAAIKRLVNVVGLEGGADRLGDQLLSVAALGFQTLLVVISGDDPVGFIRRLGEDVAPRIRATAPG